MNTLLINDYHHHHHHYYHKHYHQHHHYRHRHYYQYYYYYCCYYYYYYYYYYYRFFPFLILLMHSFYLYDLYTVLYSQSSFHLSFESNEAITMVLVLGLLRLEIAVWYYGTQMKTVLYVFRHLQYLCNLRQFSLILSYNQVYMQFLLRYCFLNWRTCKLACAPCGLDSAYQVYCLISNRKRLGTSL